MARISLSKIGLLLIPILLLFVIGMVVIGYQWNKRSSSSERALEPDERSQIEAYVGEFISAVETDEIGSLAVDATALTTEFRNSTEYFIFEFQNAAEIKQLMRDEVQMYVDEHPFTPETVSIHKAVAVDSRRFHVVLKLAPETIFENDVTYLQLELVKDGSDLALYDFGYWQYHLSFCEGLYLEQNNERSRALNRYELLEDLGVSKEDYYKMLVRFDPTHLPKNYKLDLLYSQANCLWELGRYGEAADLYDDLAGRPGQSAARLFQGRCLYEADRSAEVEAALLPYFEQIGRDSSSLDLLADAKIELEDISGAKAVYTELFRSPSAPNGLTLRSYLNCFGDAAETNEDQRAADAEELRETAYLLEENHPARLVDYATAANRAGRPEVMQTVSEIVAKSDPDSMVLDEINAIRALSESNRVAAATHYLTAYEKAQSAAEPDEEKADEYFYEWVFVLAEETGPLATLKQAPDGRTEDAFYALSEEYIWEYEMTNDWKGMVDYVAEQAPDEAWTLEAQGDYAEARGEWKAAADFFAAALAKEPEYKTVLQRSVIRNRTQMGDALAAYQQADNKPMALFLAANILFQNEETEQLESFLKKTIGEQGVDEHKPFTGNRELRDGEDAIDQEDLSRLWSNVRFLQKRYKDSRLLALQAQIEDRDFWRADRVLDCLIAEKKFDEAFAWIEEQEMDDALRADVYIGQGDVDALVAWVESNRKAVEEAETPVRKFAEFLLYTRHGEVLKKPPFFEALQAIDFDFDMDEVRLTPIEPLPPEPEIDEDATGEDETSD